MATSQNGWPVLSSGDTKKWTIPDTGRHLILAKGAAGFILVHFALWFHESVEELDDGQWDDWGWANRPIRGSTSTSNHASGTAMDLNATKHPLGVQDTFTGEQERKIRKRLDLYDGCIRWGGDYQYRADEMHFEIDATKAAVVKVAERLRDSPRGVRVHREN
jgi:hypothetical protein